MLRILVALLLLANLLFWGWTAGWLGGLVGVEPHAEREPERLNRQVRPEYVRIQGQAPTRAAPPSAGPPGASPVHATPSPATTESAAATAAPSASPASPTTPAPATTAVAAASSGPLCLEAGPFAPAEVAAAELALKSVLPAGAWSAVKAARPGLWMVYLGRFTDRDALHKRQEELRALKVEYDELRSPSDLAPGLSLGRFEERSNAGNALEKFTLRGIKGARIVEVRAPSSSITLRVDKASASQAAQLQSLTAPALGKGFTPCAK